MARFPLVVLLIPIMMPPPFASAAEAEDARLAGFFKEYLEEEFRKQPLDATRYGDHRYDHLLDDLSAKARGEAIERTRTALEQLPKRVAYDKLSRSAQIDFEIFQHHLKRGLWLAENSKPFEEDPRLYNEYITDSVFILLTQSTLPKAKNVENCVARMAHVPKVLAEAKRTLRNPPRVFVETALRQNRGSIAFYENGIFELSGEDREKSPLAAQAKKLVPLLKDYQKFLEEDLLPRAKGEWRIGKEKFARKLELELNAGLSADEVLREAEAEAVRVEEAMYVMARQLWSGTFPKKALPAEDGPGRQATIRLVLEELNKDHAKVEELVRDARADAEQIKAFITAQDILRLPDPDRCQIIEMPEFQRGNSVAFLNQAPPLDPQAVSFYAVSPPPRDWDTRRVNSFLEEYNRRMLRILTIHEAYPGHYVQLEYSSRHPSMLRRVLFSGVFAEGWAVYTEQVMLDQGYGKGDPALRLLQLKWYLRAVTNAILDHKMHCSGMTDDEALQLLTQRAFQSEGEALGKVIRAKQSSCQLSTYFVGRMAFHRLRQAVQREQGERFELGRYHEAVLAHGTLPVKYLPELVRERLKQPR